MSRTIKAFGREHSMDEHATLFVTVPDGETEAHVFVEGKLLGKRSDIEGVWLSRAMEKAEYANRLRFVSAFIEGKLSLDGAQQMATKVVERSSQAHAVNDPCLKPSETCGIDIERINKEVNAFAAR